MNYLPSFIRLLSSHSFAIDVTWVPSFNYVPRYDKAKRKPVDKPTILVLHFTATDLRTTFKQFQTNGTVSAHYTVAKDGKVYQHVNEIYRARHAGAGSWRDVKDVSTYSVGVEIENLGYRGNQRQAPGKIVPGSEHEWYDFKNQQIKSVIALSSDIVNRYRIRARNVIAHSDLAPNRKVDPGPTFPWWQLARNGIGAWVDHASAGSGTDAASVQEKLRRYGYTMVPQSGEYDKATTAGVRAFQLHFRQANISWDHRRGNCWNARCFTEPLWLQLERNVSASTICTGVLVALSLACLVMTR